MLRDRERKQCEDVLNLMSNSDLSSLLDTVTNNMIATTAQEETICAILDSSSSIEQLLKRKKVKKEYLYRYLFNRGIFMPATSEKATLIHEIVNSDTLEAPNKAKETATSEDQDTVYTEQQQLAIQFSTWFFGSWQSLIAKAQTDCAFLPSHFWPECGLRLALHSGPNLDEQEVRGAETVFQRLVALTLHERLYFNLNVSKDGARAAFSPHGMAKVAACGTVHRASSCLGRFEALFWLIRDPTAENNFKVREMLMNIEHNETASQAFLSQGSLQAVTTGGL